MKVVCERSPENSLIFKSMSKIATLFGIIPNYDYRNKKVTYRKLYRCYILCTIFLSTSCTLASTYSHCMYDNLSITIKTVNCVANMAGLGLYLIIALGSSFWNMDVWDKLVIQLSRFEQSKDLNTGTSYLVLKNSLLIFVIGTTFSVCFFIYYMLVIEPITMFRHVTTVSLYYTKFLLMNLILNVVLYIKTKYGVVYGMLNSQVPTKKNLRIIQEVRQLSLKLDSIVDTFNSYFGWPILLLIAHEFLLVLHSLSFFTSRSIRNDMVSVRINLIISTHLVSSIVSTC